MKSLVIWAKLSGIDSITISPSTISNISKILRKLFLSVLNLGHTRYKNEDKERNTLKVIDFCASISCNL